MEVKWHTTTRNPKINIQELGDLCISCLNNTPNTILEQMIMIPGKNKWYSLLFESKVTIPIISANIGSTPKINMDHKFDFWSISDNHWSILYYIIIKFIILLIYIYIINNISFLLYNMI